MTNLSALTVDASIAAVSYLAAEGAHNALLARHLTVNCTDAQPSKTALKRASEAIAARLIAAQLPVFVSPESLHAALVKAGIPAGHATVAVDHVRASNSVKPEREQPSVRQAGELATSYLLASPYLGGIKEIRPTATDAGVPS